MTLNQRTIDDILDAITRVLRQMGKEWKDAA